MYNKVDTNMNFVDREKETEKFWRENDIFKKSMENRKEGETYTFYDGPPTANGKPHIGHVETRTIKDMIPRFQTMKGKYVPRKAGWDALLVRIIPDFVVSSASHCFKTTLSLNGTNFMMIPPFNIYSFLFFF